ncbi:malto-oligosyltrehalose trehalohydrolase [Candidatus Methylacidiphilum infernorum]|uniref:Malto-oligosyltrehalose trehalohydrolase n=1 Tax=Methylacidiphilum infernorum (isolate V4) TaxID=481448 RepID=B3DUS2_METI4|nr:malto-oligosyltrehalose trehalohydrolase [Candidatus Methylacidiphilum infernorum]ACD83075.1 1,4-alpha-glucan branching enzyme [Methylacidiphilum infernorum V4]
MYASLLQSVIPVGAIPTSDSVLFTAWGPFLEDCKVHVYEPEDLVIPMEKDKAGYWRAFFKGSNKSKVVTYKYLINEKEEYPDPASRYQPFGVHGRSAVVHFDERSIQGTLEPRPILADYVIYELHVGTFTPQGTFEAIIPRLPELKQLGINCIEIMPVAQFPGKRNWGYDGVYPFAVQNSYGGPWGLRKLVDSCHQLGMAVILDVVYNHLGPEGNYLSKFGPYFTSKYKTPWGEAINFDDAFCDAVRNYFIYNALFWFSEYDIDALRLDAVHAIYDESAYPFLEELADKTTEYCNKFQKTHFLIIESDRNDPRFIYPKSVGGYALHAQWCDDFHHALHAYVTGENKGYYADFGSLEQLAKALQQGYVIDGCYSSFRKRKHGRKPLQANRTQLIVFSQNHDQVGNRFMGERLSTLVGFEELKIIAALTLLSGFVVLLFMGEEYGEKNPFYYFVDHGDPALLEAVREGRKREFQAFHGGREGYDPTTEEAWQKCILQWDLRNTGKHGVLWKLYKECLGLRKQLQSLKPSSNSSPKVYFDEKTKLFSFLFENSMEKVVGITNFDSEQRTFFLEKGTGPLEKILDLAEERWHGPGSLSPIRLAEESLSFAINPKNFVLYRNPN